MRQSSDHFAFDWNRVGDNLLVEGLAERDCVAAPLVVGGLRSSGASELEPHRIHKVEAFCVNNGVPSGLLFGPEEHRGCEDPLESGLNPAVLSSVLGEVKMVEQSSWTAEVNRAGFLLEGQSGNPDGDQSVLAIR